MSDEDVSGGYTTPSGTASVPQADGADREVETSLEEDPAFRNQQSGSIGRRVGRARRDSGHRSPLF